MKRLALIVAWIAVVVTAVFLRFQHLGDRPFHADEATGARITAYRMTSDGGEFNPTHFHGPLLADFAMAVCRLRGETDWTSLTKYSLRLLPALAGSLLVLVPLCWRRYCGDWACWLAAALLGTSPLLVYYSRTFIHESLLVLFGVSALMVIVAYPKWGLPGLLLGLMFATKESFVISVLAWSGAAAVVLWENRRSLDRERCMAFVREYWRPSLLSVLVGISTALLVYTDAFRHLQGAVDAVRTFFVYKTVNGHDKPWTYYLVRLFLPYRSAGIWWFGTPVALLALLAYLGSFRGQASRRQRNLVHFLFYATLGHLLIYTCFAYKTPWLVCLPWAHVCVLAGLSLWQFEHRSRLWRVLLVLMAGTSLISQARQARLATGHRLNSNFRNPYAYVPTRRDVEGLARWLGELKQGTPLTTESPVAVVGDDYWPLPWYLRGFRNVGYWKTPPRGLKRFPLILAMPAMASAVGKATHDSHVGLLRGLRPDVPVMVFVRNDVWNAWMNAGSP